LLPDVAGGEGHDPGLADHRHGVKVESVKRLAGRQAGFGEVTFEMAAAALGHLVLGQRGQKAGRRPAFLVGLGSELGPDLLDAGQVQLGQQQCDAGGVDRIGRLHAAPPIGAPTAPSSS
jgi:hypothetical protein